MRHLIVILAVSIVFSPSILSAQGSQVAPNSSEMSTSASTVAANKMTVDVRTLGAVGDGVTEDTAAFQAAVDRAAELQGIVKVPAGRYLVGSIRLPSHVIVAGEGEASVMVLKTQPPLASPGHPGRTPFDPGHMFLPKNMSAVASVEDVEIRDLRLLGNSAQQNGGGPAPHQAMLHGIAILGGKGWVVRRVHAEDFDGDGIYLGANALYPGAVDYGNGKIVFPNGQQPTSQPLAADNIIEDSVVLRNLRNGMMIAHGDRNVIRRNRFEENQRGVACDPIPGPDRICTNMASYPKYKREHYESAELDLEPNRIKVVNGTVVAWQQVTNTLIEGNFFLNGHRMGIQMVKLAANIAGNRIINNTFQNIRGGSIVIFADGAHNNLISGNVFKWNGPNIQSWVLRIRGGDGNRVIGNRFEGPVRLGDKVVRFESGSTIRIIRCTEFSGNTVNVPSGADETLVSFDRQLLDNVVHGNLFPAGGIVDVWSWSVLHENEWGRCQQQSE